MAQVERVRFALLQRSHPQTLSLPVGLREDQRKDAGPNPSALVIRVDVQVVEQQPLLVRTQDDQADPYAIRDHMTRVLRRKILEQPVPGAVRVKVIDAL